MKKIWLSILCAVLICTSFLTPCSAEGKAYNWYCVHAKDHVQPRVGSELAFAEELGGYYIDRRHQSMDNEEKVVYLTFDAGYENGNVAKILDVMKAEGVTGAFFILGNLITRDTALVKRMADEGHLVCNHTVRHKDMTKMSNADFLKELKELEALYEEHGGAKMASYYRPPEGRFTRENLMCAEENGYKTVFWSFAYPDWDNDRQMPHEMAKSIILDNVHNGEVMLLHPTSETNAAILGDVIRELKAQGFRFGTLDELTATAEAD